MDSNTSTEKQLQNNTINLLKSKGYTFISQEKNVNFRNQQLFSVLLKDILVNQLQKLLTDEVRVKI